MNGGNVAKCHKSINLEYAINPGIRYKHQANLKLI